MKDNLKNLISLLRINQWYKNLLIFIAIFLVGRIFELEALITVIIGFFILSFISSAGYIINDIVDVKKDRLHIEKKYRAIVSGKVPLVAAVFIAVILVLSSLIIAYLLNPYFILFPIILLLSYVSYTIYFKKIAILDLYFIAFNHLLRAFAGAYLMSVVISPWFILFIFLLAMFLPAAKRRSDISMLNNGLKKQSVTSSIYNKKFLEWLVIILLTAMFLSYILYSFMAYDTYYFMITIPFASFLIFRYLYFISIDHKIVRKTEYFFLDKQMLIAFLLWFISAFLAVYVFV